MSEYVLYYHDDRIHLGLAKDTPAGRSKLAAPPSPSKIISPASTRWAASSPHDRGVK
jgi:hypothetical protein